MTTERPLSAAPDLDDLWSALWDDLRHNATGQPSGHAIIHRHRDAIEDAARATALAEVARLREALETLTDALDLTGADPRVTVLD